MKVAIVMSCVVASALNVKLLLGIKSLASRELKTLKTSELVIKLSHQVVKLPLSDV
jgi:hypothetical protein